METQLPADPVQSEVCTSVYSTSVTVMNKNVGYTKINSITNKLIIKKLLVAYCFLRRKMKPTNLSTQIYCDLVNKLPDFVYPRKTTKMYNMHKAADRFTHL